MHEVQRPADGRVLPPAAALLGDHRGVHARGLAVAELRFRGVDGGREVAVDADGAAEDHQGLVVGRADGEPDGRAPFDVGAGFGEAGLGGRGVVGGVGDYVEA